MSCEGVYKPSRWLAELCTSLQHKSYSASSPDNTRLSGIKLPEGQGLGLFILCASHGSLPLKEELSLAERPPVVSVVGTEHHSRSMELELYLDLRKKKFSRVGPKGRD